MLPLAEAWLLHPLRGLGYQFYSGVGSSLSEWATVLLALTVYVRRHNCHQPRCPFLAWHPHPDDPDGHLVCRLHHPHHHGMLTRLRAFLYGLTHEEGKPPSRPLTTLPVLLPSDPPSEHVVRYHREQLGLTQAQTAKQTGVGPGTVRRVEREAASAGRPIVPKAKRAK